MKSRPCFGSVLSDCSNNSQSACFLLLQDSPVPQQIFLKWGEKRWERKINTGYCCFFSVAPFRE